MTEAHVRAVVRRWQKALGLGGWDIDVVFPEANYKDTANCEASPEYKQAVIYLNMTKLDDTQLEDYVRHELFHAVIWPLGSLAHDLAGDNKILQEQIRKAEERVCTDLETMPLWSELS